MHQQQLQQLNHILSWLRKICLNEFRMALRSEKDEESYEELCESWKQFVSLQIDPLTQLVSRRDVKQVTP